MKALLALFILTFVLLAQAGRVKEVYYDHERAIAIHLWGVEENFDEIKNTRFVKADSGFYMAVASDIQIYDSKSKQWQWITCTSQFLKAEGQNVKHSTLRCL